MLILGVDPGTRNLGYAVLDVTPQRLTLLVGDVLKLKASDSMHERMCLIWEHLNFLIGQYQPAHLALEDIFVKLNIQVAFKLGQVRGVVILAAALAKMGVYEYSPREVKKALTGNGNASKEQVAYMARHFFPYLSETALPDMTDAVAVAICHSHRLASEGAI